MSNDLSTLTGRPTGGKGPSEAPSGVNRSAADKAAVADVLAATRAYMRDHAEALRKLAK